MDMEPSAIDNADSLLFTCEECDFVAQTSTGFTYHQDTHKGNRGVCCNYCSYSSKYPKIVVKHMNTCHQSVSASVDDDNSKQANTKIHEVRSVSEQVKNPFKCCHCSRSYSRKTDLMRHMQNVHGNLDSSVCHRSALKCVDDSIPKTDVSVSKTEARTELPEVHSETKQLKSDFDCHHCLRSYSRKTDLTRHIQNVHGISDSTLKCKITKSIRGSNLGVKRCRYCSFKSRWPGTVNKHIQRVHVDVRRFQCKLCTYRCNDMSNMRKHLKRIHKCLDRKQCIVLSENLTSVTINKYKHSCSVINKSLFCDKSHLSDVVTPEVEQKPCSSTENGSMQPKQYVSVTDKKKAKKFVVKSISTNVIEKRLGKGSSEARTRVKRSMYISRHANMTKVNLKSAKPRLDEVSKCEVCSRVFACKSLLYKHSVVHTDLRRYRCSVCGWRSNFLTSMKNHVVKFHNSITSFVLLTVAEAGDTIKSYKRHQLKISHLKVQQTELNSDKKKSYNTSKHFRVSSNYNKSVLDDNNCVDEASVTRENYTTPSSLSIDKKLKLQLKFNKSKPYNKKNACAESSVFKPNRTTPLLKCPSCPKVFAKPNLLYVHSLWHADLRCFKCKSCGLRSNFDATLRRHVKSVHRGRATFTQLSVNEAKSTIESYKALVKKQVVPVVEQISSSSTELSKSIMYKKSRQAVGIKTDMSSSPVSCTKNTIALCTICGMKFVSRQSLKSHAIVHSDLRRFQCLTCNWRTNFKGNMHNHLISIHGILDYNSSYHQLSVEEAAATVDRYKSTFPQGTSATRRFKTLKSPSDEQGKHLVVRTTGLEIDLPVVATKTDTQIYGQKASKASVSKTNVDIMKKADKMEISEVAGDNSDDVKKTQKKFQKNRHMKSFKCDLCSFRSLYRGSLDRHRRRFHKIAADVPAACSASPSITDILSDEHSISSLLATDDLQLQHMKKAGKSSRQPLGIGYQPYMCSHCHHRTNLVSTLTRHLLRCHSSAKLVKLSLKEAKKTFAKFQKPSSLSGLREVRKRQNIVSIPEFEENTLQTKTEISSDMNSQAVQQLVSLEQCKKRYYECSSCNFHSDRRFNIRKHITGCDPTAKILEAFDDLKATALSTLPGDSKCLNLLVNEKKPKIVSKMFVPMYQDTSDQFKLRRFYCVLCGYRSSYKYDVVRHLFNIHPDSNVTVAKMSLEDARKSLQCYESSARFRRRHKNTLSSSSVQSDFDIITAGEKVEAAEEHLVDARVCKSEDIKKIKTPVKSIEKAELNLVSLRKRGLLSPRIPLVPICSEPVRMDNNLSSMVKWHADFTGRGDKSICDDSQQLSCKRWYTKQKQKTMENMRIFKCSECDYCSKWWTGVYRHRRKHLQDSQTIRISIPRTISESNSRPGHESGLDKCARCPYRSLSKLELQRHTKLAHRRTKRRYLNNPESFKFQCPFCQFSTNWAESLKRHIASIHPEDKPNQTNNKEGISSEIISSLYTESTRTTTDTSQKFQVACERLTLNKVDSKYFRRFKCSSCPSRKNSKVDVLKHIQIVHSGMGSVKVLSKKFAKDTLAEYFKLHGKHFRKSNCVDGSAERQSHVTAIDKGDTKSSLKLDVNCPSASEVQPMESFAQKGSTGDDHSLPKQTVDSRQLVDVKFPWLSCDKCPFISIHSHNLREHRLRHRRKSTAQLKCDLCSYTCSSYQVLNKHAAVHMPNYRNTRTMTLTSLRSISIPDDILKCDQCPFLTKTLTALSSHKQMHQPRTLVRHGCDLCQFWSLGRNTILRHYHVHQAGYAQKRINSLSNTTLKPTKQCKMDKLSKPAQSSTSIQQSDSAKKSRPLQLVDASVEVEMAALKQKLIASRFRDEASCSSSQLPFDRRPSEEPVPNTDHLIQTPSNVVNFFGDVCETAARQEATAVSIHDTENNDAVVDVEADNGCSKKMRQLWRCDKCPYAVIDIGRLRNHISMHGRGLPYQCTYCNYSAFRYWCLARHHKLHFLHNQNLLNSQSVKNLILLPPRVKQLTVNSCEEDVTRNDMDDLDDPGKLSVPLFSKFRCSRCPFVAEQRLELCAHLRCHVLGSKMSCPFCDFSTASSTPLRSHVLSHFNLPGMEWSALPPRSRASKTWTSIVTDIESYVQKWCKNQFEKTKNGDLAAYTKVSRGVPVSDGNMNLLYEDQHTNCQEGELSRQGRSQFKDIRATYPLSRMMSRVKSEVVAQSQESISCLPTASSNFCQYCDRLLGSTDLLARHEAGHLIGNQFKVNTGFNLLFIVSLFSRIQRSKNIE